MWSFSQYLTAVHAHQHDTFSSEDDSDDLTLNEESPIKDFTPAKTTGDDAVEDNVEVELVATRES